MSERRMTFTIISNVTHKVSKNGTLSAYGPYVNEMNLWLRHVDRLVLVAPVVRAEPNAIDVHYEFKNIQLLQVPLLDFTALGKCLKSLFVLPYVFWQILRGMAVADHIHLRCPGNMGLLGCVAQAFFPNKPKSAKYAGNWDWSSRQPITYRRQQHLLKNEKWSKHMTVLVYGRWGDTSRNVLPFFTASYSKSEALPVQPRQITERPLHFLFVGKLDAGKRPLLSVQVVEMLLKQGLDCELTLLGEGSERQAIERYVAENALTEHVYCAGNVNREEIIRRYKQSHFLLFASKSEGWPKAVAEAMWWGCVPITTAVSCVPQMLDHGGRGVLVEPQAQAMAEAVLHYLGNEQAYSATSEKAMQWAREYTLERFEEEICRILNRK